VFRAHAFSSACKAARLEAGLTIMEVGELADYYGYKSVEADDIDNMKMQNFLAVCNALDLDPNEFFALEE
jgi:hypothetical protein